MLTEAEDEEVAFCLDECLPYIVARALSLVGYHVEDHDSLGLIGRRDEFIIPWLSQRGYVWITADEAARKQHAHLMVQNQLSVVWVRGMNRKSSAGTRLSTRGLHRVITVRIDDIATKVSEADGPRHFALGMSGKRVTLERLQEQRIRAHAPLPLSRRARRRRRR